MTVPSAAVPSSGSLPSGTVTFAFTDIEGSTQRWERDRSAMEDAVRRHDAIVRAAIVQNGGHVFKTIGDAFCASFARPGAAVAAILAAQRALAAEDFSAIDGVRVRAAIHTGTADERDGDYFGSAVNRVARLLAIGHGGQVLVSGVTADLVQGDMPPKCSLRDLGEHRLKDLTQAEQVYQLVSGDVPDTFPPLRSLESLPNNLPLQLTSFVGRAEEVAEIAELIGSTRLLTLVGTGGVGKTRTALQVAAELLDGSGDGVWFVDLAPIRDPALVPFEIAAALGLSIPPEKGAIEAVAQYLKSRRLLLIVDNCEHLVAAAATAIDAILRGCPRVKVLATSREGLNVNGESVYRMPSLGLPPVSATLGAVEAAAYGAIALFAERARAADGRFVLTDENAPIVAEVCRRLDGIALAIELAAPRVKVLAVEQLSRRLDERFRILTGGSRNALPRQQTMRALIDWSYDLLSENEKLVFRRAGIFVGGFTLEAVSAVCSADTTIDEWEVLDILSTLVDKSLVGAEIAGSQQRYRLLESMREYARARLVESDELERIARVHAGYFHDYAAVKRDQWDVTPGDQWIAPMLPEIDNFRAALEWSLKHDRALEAELAIALHRFFDRLALQTEGLKWADSALAADDSLELGLEIRLTRVRSTLCLNQGRLDLAIAASERALSLARTSGDRRLILDSLLHRSFATHVEGWEAQAEEALALAKAIGDELDVSRAHVLLAESPKLDIERRRELLAAGLATQRRLKRHRVAALTLMRWTLAELAAGDASSAKRIAAQLLDAARPLEATVLLRSLAMVACACLKSGDTENALGYAREQLELSVALNKPFDCGLAVLVFVALNDDFDDPVRSARLLGFADIQSMSGALATTFEQYTPLAEAAAARLRAALGDAAFEVHALEGSAWDLETVSTEVLKLGN